MATTAARNVSQHKQIFGHNDRLHATSVYNTGALPASQMERATSLEGSQ